VHEASFATTLKVQSSPFDHYCPKISTEYWSSPELNKLFGKWSGEITQKSILKQIELLLHNVNCSDKEYLEVIEDEIDD